MPGPEPTEPAPASPAELDQMRRTSMAAERTWLAWWRSALAASAGALAVGRLAPDLLHVAPWPYIALWRVCVCRALCCRSAVVSSPAGGPAPPARSRERAADRSARAASLPHRR